MSDHGWSPGRKGVLTLALAAVAAAVVLVVVVLRAQVSEPTPHSAGRIDPGTPSAQPHHRDGGQRVRVTGPTKVPLGPSRPVSLQIPAIGVDTPVHPLGLNADGTLAVPQPGPRLNHAAWFDKSPTPGQPGPSIIEGHVDSTEGPSVFLKLGDVRPGDRVVVTRADGRVLTFRVDAVRNYLKTRFPTQLVYGGLRSQSLTPTLRLITCSDFDPSIDHHVGNEVVFAHLVHATPATAS